MCVCVCVTESAAVWCGLKRGATGRAGLMRPHTKGGRDVRTLTAYVCSPPWSRGRISSLAGTAVRCCVMSTTGAPLRQLHSGTLDGMSCGRRVSNVCVCVECRLGIHDGAHNESAAVMQAACITAAA
jgi:hypothetical protein